MYLLTCPNHSPLCDSVHASLCVSRSVWGPLRFSPYAHLVTVKMVSRLCVSLCEAGGESFLFICPPVTVHKRSATSVLTSSLRSISLSCSTEDSEDHRVGRGIKMWPLSSWEFRQELGVKSPFIRRAVRWMSSCGGLSKEGGFGAWGEPLRPTWLVAMGENIHQILVIYKQESLLAWERDRKWDKNRCPRLHGSCYLLAPSAVGGKFEV